MANVSALRTGSSRRFNKRDAAFAFAVVAASFGATLSARADTFGNNGGSTLNVSSSWIDETNAANSAVPGSADIAAFDGNALLTVPTTYSLGAPASWLGLLVANPGAAITISDGANPMTLGTSGIDMSAAAQNVTLIPSALTLSSAQTWNVASGRTLTVSSTVDTGGNTLTFLGAGTTVIANTVSNTGSVVIAGSAVTLSGGNTYSGGTTLNSGTLNVNNAAALGTGPLTIAGGAINNTSAAAITTGNNAININGSFAFTGTGALSLGSGAISLGATPTITVNGTGANGVLTLGGSISGGFGLTKAGAGTLVLAGANTYSGATTLNAGTLNFNSMAALGAGTTLNFNGGTLQYAGGNSADISTDTVTFAGNATIDTGGNFVTFANPIGNGGAGGFTKTGGGTLVLAATNNYLGNTTVTGSNASATSTLVFQTLASLGSGSAININNGTLMYTQGNAVDITTRNVTVTGTLATVDVNGTNVTYANPITGTGTLTFASSAGPATVTLNAASQYSGALGANNGVTLALGNIAALQSANVTLNAGSNVNFGTATAVTFGGLSGAQNLNLQNTLGQPVALTIGTAGGLYSGAITDGGSGATVTKISGSTWTVRGPSTYTGNTTVNGGQLLLDWANTVTTSGTSMLYNTGTPGTLILGGASIFENNKSGTTSFQVFNGVVLNQGASSFFQNTRQSNGKLVMTLGAFTVNPGGTVDVVPNTGNSGSTSTTTANGASGILGGWATAQGGAEWARAGTGGSIAGGATYVNAFAANTQNTDMTANLTATSSATTGSVRFNSATGTPTLTLNGNNVIASGGILVTPTVGTSTPQIVSTASTDTLSSGTNQLYVQQYDINGPLTIASTIADNGAGSVGLVKSGVGTLILSGANTFTGGVYLNAGNLVIGSAGALNSTTPNFVSFGNSDTPVTSSNSTFTVTSGTLTLKGTSVALPQISTANVSAGTPVIQNANANAATLTITGSSPSTFSGTVQDGTGGGKLSLTVAGTGGLTLSGSNTYTGTTTISSGTLALASASNNISGSKLVTLNSGSTLDVTKVTGGFTLALGQTLTGSGTVAGTLSVGSGATVNPGLSGTGTLAATGFTLNAGATMNFEFASPTTGDLVNVGANGLTINGGAGSVLINLLQPNSSSALAAVGTYDLFQYLGSIGGAGVSALTTTNLPIGLNAAFGTATSGGNNFVTVTVTDVSSTFPNWKLSGGGTWNSAADWSTSTIPSGVGSTAILGNAVLTPSTITLDAPQTLGAIGFNNANSYTIAASGAESLVMDNGASNATLNVSLGNHTISAPVSLNSNLVVNASAGSLTISGIVSGAKSVTMSGAGTLVLSNANTYTGGTVINSGVLQVANNAALSAAAVTFSGNGNLQAGAANLLIANPIVIGSGATATVDTQAQTMTLSGVISSTNATGGLMKIGSGTLIVTGTNTLSNTVTINGGTLQVGNGVAGGSLNGAAIADNATLAYNLPASGTISNTITGSGAVVQNANNTLTLSGNNGFSGGINVNNNGTVALLGTAQNAAGTGPITLNNGTLTPNNPAGGTLANNLIIPTAANGTLNLANGTAFAGGVLGNGTLNLNITANATTITGDWSTFTGQVNLAGSGNFRINIGNFNAQSARFNLSGTGNLNTLIAGGGLTLGDLTGSGGLVGNNNTASLTVGGAELPTDVSVYSGTVSDGATGARAFNITKVGPGTLNFTGNFTAVHGSISVNAGTFTLANAAFTNGNAMNGLSTSTGATLDLAGYSPSIQLTNAGTDIAISGNGGVIGSSSTTTPTTITVNGTGTYAGAIQDSVTVSTGAGIQTGNQTTALIINGGTETLSGKNTYTGGTQIQAGTLQLGAGGTSGSIVATPTTTISNNGLLAFNRSDNVAFGAIISGAGGVTQLGTGILSLTNPSSSFSGGVTISNGTLQMVSGVPLGNGQVPVTLNAGVLDLNDTSTTIGSLTGAAAGTVDNVSAGGAATLTTGALSVDVTFAGTIKNTTGTVALVKNGSGNLTLSGGASTYSGGTTLNSGAIYATNTTGSATGSGPVVLNGGILGGTGIVGGTITAGSGPHTISPGATANAIGTLTAGGLSTNANTTLAIDLAAPGATNDLIAITGNVSLGGGNITLTTNSLSGVGSLGYYEIMTYTGTLSGIGMTIAAASTDPNVVYTLDTSTAGLINIHKGFIGDANDDGSVDLSDLSVVLNNFGATTTSWRLGNFDGANTIDLTDLSNVLNNFGATVSTTAISTGSPLAATPEPASLVLLAPGDGSNAPPQAPVESCY